MKSTYLIISLTLFLLASELWANGIAQCNNCNSKQSLYAVKSSGFTGQVFVLNFSRHLIRKYLVWKERDDNVGRLITYALPQEVSYNEKKAFDELDAYIDNIYAKVSQEVKLNQDEINPITCVPYGTEFGAYDVIENVSLSSALFDTVTPEIELVLNTLSAFEELVSVLKVVDLDFQIEVRVIFPDGTMGVAAYQDGQFVFDDNKFFDSTGNILLH